MKENNFIKNSDLEDFISDHRKELNLSAGDVVNVRNNESLMSILNQKAVSFLNDFCLDSLPFGHYDIHADILCDILSDELVKV